MGSRSDKLFQKRKAGRKKDYSRRRRTLSERRRSLIVCEGEKTEPDYFRFLIEHLSLTTAEVEVCGDCGSAPISVVKFGKKKFAVDPDFEEIYFVFDGDCHPSYNEALKLVENLQGRNKKKSFQAITSNPCFELWFLMHYKSCTKPFSARGNRSPCDDLIASLKRYPGFNNYSKSQRQPFGLLQARMQEAKQNAAQSLEQLENSRAPTQTKHHINPSTFVHKLVEAMECLAEQQKR